MKAVTTCRLSLIFLLLALLGGADALAADQPDTQPLIILTQSGGSGSAGGSGGGTGGGSGEEWAVADPEALEWAVEVQGPQAAARADPAQVARVWEAAARGVRAPAWDLAKQGRRRAANRALVLDSLTASDGAYGGAGLTGRCLRHDDSFYLVMTKRQIARILFEIAFFLRLKDGNPYKSRAYEGAARALLLSPYEPHQLLDSNTLTAIPGIGPATAAVIRELLLSGTSSLHQRVKDSYPASLVELGGVPGLRPKQIRRLYEEAGIRSVSELQAACRNNQLQALKGIGPKIQAKIQTALGEFRRGQAIGCTRACWKKP